jgi:hypothetical protein
VALCDGGGLLTHPQSTAPRINKLDTTFIFVSSFNRHQPLRVGLSTRSAMPDSGLARICHRLITHVCVVGCPTPQQRTVLRFTGMTLGSDLQALRFLPLEFVASTPDLRRRPTLRMRARAIGRRKHRQRRRHRCPERLRSLKPITRRGWRLSDLRWSSPSIVFHWRETPRTDATPSIAKVWIESQSQRRDAIISR